MLTLRLKTALGQSSGWFLILYFAVLPVVWWLTLNPISGYFSSAYETFSTLGKISGMLGLMLYAINFLLATRLKFLESLFGGLNRVYIAHHVAGGLALIFVLLHPVFLTVRLLNLDDLASFKWAAKFLLPDFSSPQGSYLGRSYNLAVDAGIVAFWGMVVLLVITFFVKLPYKVWLFIHRFLGPAFLLAGLHVYWSSRT